MPDWVTLTVELEGCEPIDCRVELSSLARIETARAIERALREKMLELALRSQELIESRGCGRVK